MLLYTLNLVTLPIHRYFHVSHFTIRRFHNFPLGKTIYLLIKRCISSQLVSNRFIYLSLQCFPNICNSEVIYLLSIFNFIPVLMLFPLQQNMVFIYISLIFMLNYFSIVFSIVFKIVLSPLRSQLLLYTPSANLNISVLYPLIFTPIRLLSQSIYDFLNIENKINEFIVAYFFNTSIFYCYTIGIK